MSLARATDNLVRRQKDGCFPAAYDGPNFLLPGFVFAWHLVGETFDESERRGLVAQLRATQNVDGGWGLSVEGPSTLFGTTMSYVALRLLGERDGRARARLFALGGAEAVASWGKLWLALLGVYEWTGVPALPPELWLLPRVLPLHPARMWCHTREVLLPMSHLWATRPAPPPLPEGLRAEVFTTPLDAIDWPRLRDQIADSDRAGPPAPLATLAQGLSRRLERTPLRDRALRRTARLLDEADASSSSLGIGPVSKALHLVVTHGREGRSAGLMRQLARARAYFHRDDDRLTVRGYHGTELWDVVFAARALAELPGDPARDRAWRDAYAFVDAQQVLDTPPTTHRDEISGGWPFSTKQQGWIVSDCTAEAIAVALRPPPGATAIAMPRLRLAVDRLLAMQSDDGGWSEYERPRGGALLDALDPRELFVGTMRARSHVECTSACVRALCAFRDHDAHLRSAVDRAIARGVRFLRRSQRRDGSWYGAWGVCFVYGTWFAIEALRVAGATSADPAIARARHFLVEHQHADGGWGEDFASCTADRFVHAPRPHSVQTAWGVLALLAAGGAPGAVARACALLEARQQDDGGWPRERPVGVFNGTCAIDYDNYRHVMPLWALARHGVQSAA